MNKYLIFLIFMLWITNPLQSQIIEKEYFNNNGFKPDLKGPVKSQKLTVMLPSFYIGKLEIPEQAYILKERYNDKQIRTVEELYNVEGVLIGKSAILHDRNGFATEILYTDVFDNLLNRITYEYNDDGNWKRVVNYDVYYNPLEIIYYYYNSNKEISQIRKTDEGGNVLSRELFIYNSRDLNSERTLYDSLWHMVSRTQYLYDIRGNNISSRVLSADGETMQFYEAFYKNDSIPQYSVIDYYNDKSVILSIKYIFDNLGNVIQTIKTDNSIAPSTKSTTDYLYEWDLWGNWTKQIINSNDSASVIATRDIEYYITKDKQ